MHSAGMSLVRYGHISPALSRQQTITGQCTKVRALVQGSLLACVDFTIRPSIRLYLYLKKNVQ
jgi:hypothetical protein